MFLNPIIGMLHNTKEETWHPILFDERPLAGSGGPMRHKSSMHHTAGFKTREEALENAKNDLAPKAECTKFALEKDFEWDGEDIPALVVFFDENEDGSYRPAF